MVGRSTAPARWSSGPGDAPCPAGPAAPIAQRAMASTVQLSYPPRTLPRRPPESGTSVSLSARVRLDRGPANVYSAYEPMKLATAIPLVTDQAVLRLSPLALFRASSGSESTRAREKIRAVLVR